MRTKITFTTVPIHSFRILIDICFSITSIYIRQRYRDSNPRPCNQETNRYSLPQRIKLATLKKQLTTDQATDFMENLLPLRGTSL